MDAKSFTRRPRGINGPPALSDVSNGPVFVSKTSCLCSISRPTPSTLPSKVDTHLVETLRSPFHEAFLSPKPWMNTVYWPEMNGAPIPAHGYPRASSHQAFRFVLGKVVESNHDSESDYEANDRLCLSNALPARSPRHESSQDDSIISHADKIAHYISSFGH